MELQRNKIVGFYVIVILISALCGTDGSCTFPSSIRDTWYSSNGGTLGFSSTKFTNFKIATFGSYTFTCQINSGTKYVSKSDIFYVFNLPFVAYICMDLTAITGYKYTYYQPTSMLRDAQYNRLKIYLNNSVTISSVNDICEISDYTELTRHILLKNDSISTQKIQCPTGLLGKFNYTFDKGSGNLCTGNTSLDVCTDNTMMKFDYSQCSQKQAYSVGGQVNCLYYTTSGTTSYLHVFNLDATTDESTYFRFTCYVLETIGSIIYATQYPQDCHYGQNSTNVNSTGANLVLMSSKTCVPTETTASANIGIIIAIIILILIIILAILFGLYMYKKKKEKEKQKKVEEQRTLEENTIREKIENPDLRPEMDLGLPDDSKYNIDRLMYSDDKMVTPSNIEIERMRSQGFEGFDDFDDEYMDEYTRQNMIDASLFLDKRQRLEPIDEFDVDEKENSSFMKRFKELARSRIKRKKRRGGKSKSKKKKGKKGNDSEGVKKKKKKRLVLDLGTIDADDWESDDEGDDGDGDGDGDEGDDVNLPGQVEHIEEPKPPMATIGPVLYQRNILAERKVENTEEEKKGKKKKKKKKKKDYGDSEDDDEVLWQTSPEPIPTPRLILPNLRPEETDTDDDYKSKKGGKGLTPRKTKSSLASLRSFRSMRKAKVNNWTKNEDVEIPMYLEDPKLKDLPPLQRVHRKKNPQLWSDILAKYSGDLDLPSDPNKLRWSESKWRNLLEELYTDKRYFDYMTKSAKDNPAERDVISEANEGLGYLHQRANFWKNQEPIPGRPSSSWRSSSFVHSAGSRRVKTPKKSKSFINSPSLKTTESANSHESSTESYMSSKENEKNKLRREKSALSKEPSMSKKKSRERSLLKENSSLSKEPSMLSREKSNVRKEKSPDNSKNTSTTNTPRPKKIHLPKIDKPETVYKIDMLPKTPMTQVRIDIDREESML